jgi:hypothetical protein
LLDARDNSAHAQDGLGQVIGAPTPTLAGGLPMLTPNQTNRIYILRTVQPSEAWTLTTVAGVSVSYWPRYLTVRPATT